MSRSIIAAMTVRNRVTSVDALRGAIMVIMALDHVRDFVHHGAMAGQSPTDLATTTPLLFMTRWVTHFCAPVFFFTAGLGAFFWYQRGRSRRELSAFLLSRGLWLIVLELTVMRFAYTFVMGPSQPILLLVLWGLGLSMIVLAAWIWLPARMLATTSLAVIVLHNLADPVAARPFGNWAWLWNVVHQLGAFTAGGWTFVTPYPLVPWVAIMAAGFACGSLFTRTAPERQRLLFRLGAGATVAFLLVRGLNVYGDPAPWTTQASGMFTVLSFLNTTKYPPSLSFTLMTLGPALVALAWLDRRHLDRANPLAVLGRVPLFFFLTHFMLAHLAVVALSYLTYGSAATAFAFLPLPSVGGDASAFPTGFGYDLWVVYLVWAVIVAGLYPACRWFAAVKDRRRAWWLSYL
jgi:uncharacterized membrane protein